MIISMSTFYAAFFFLLRKVDYVIPLSLSVALFKLSYFIYYLFSNWLIIAIKPSL
jgi:hypothetical protein